VFLPIVLKFLPHAPLLSTASIPYFLQKNLTKLKKTSNLTKLRHFRVFGKKNAQIFFLGTKMAEIFTRAMLHVR
jgi:hypothetical protein